LILDEEAVAEAAGIAAFDEVSAGPQRLNRLPKKRSN
jgi:hypothetical protein